MKQLIFLLTLVFSVQLAVAQAPTRRCHVCQSFKKATEFSGNSFTCKACAQKKPETRTCSSCKKTKALNAFSGSSKICKECAKPKLKSCSVCQQNKPVVEFSRSSNECKECEDLRIIIEENKNDYVDLGLPSGTLWATRNIGANSPKEFGDHFAWGETKGYKSGKTEFTWSTYKWSKGDKNKLTKYCDKTHFGNNGFTDNKTELDLEDDAAYVNWGSNWRIPSLEQQNELREKCTWKWVTYKGTSGYVVKGSNGKSIFFPAAGLYEELALNEANSGWYWSRTLYTSNPGYPDHPEYARRLHFSNNIINGTFVSRYVGLTIRPVRISQQEAEQIAAREKAEKERIAREQRDLRDGKCVDLGLPSGTLWATCNLGASTPEEYGEYYAWGEIKPKDNYDWDSYRWCNGSSAHLTKYTSGDGKTELDLEDDAAYANSDGKLRMPSLDQIKELIDNCKWQWVTLNGIKGREATSKFNGKTIFFPAAGWHVGPKNNDFFGSYGVYLSRTLYNTSPDCTWYLGFNSDSVYCATAGGYRHDGCNIRPVRLKR